MPLTKEDLADFNRFAEQKLNNGGASSIEQLASEWREACELAEDIKQAEADIAAGKGKPVDEVFTDIRKNLGLEQ